MFQMMIELLERSQTDFNSGREMRFVGGDVPVLKGEPRWIPVTERLPDEPGHFLVVVKEKYAFDKDYSYDTDVAHYRLDGGYIDGCWNTFCDWDEGQPYLHVTHWMPLPEPPKE